MTSSAMLQALCRQHGTLLHLPAPNQHFVRIADGEQLRAMSRALHEQGFYLVTLAGVDERRLLDRCFKLTYLFSHPTDDLFLFVENPLAGPSDAARSPIEPDATDGVTYASLYAEFAAVEPFERELADMLGLFPAADGGPPRIRPGAWLHEECYPPALYPLRRDRTTTSIREALQQHTCTSKTAPALLPLEGEWTLPVGPIHAGVIEPGQFLFRLAGEGVEEITIRLGYTHKGIERLFQSDFTLADGWRLAEHVAGDSAFAHSLAYCQAVEALADVQPSRPAELLRGLFLELERMANHIGDCGALAQDVAYDAVATELGWLRERLLQLNEKLAGQRLLRGLNRPGGLVLPRALARDATSQIVREVADQFADLAEHLAHLPGFRDRLQWTGILTQQQALRLGITGLAARASGIRRDARLDHPAGVYRDKRIQELVRAGLPMEGQAIEAREATAGDALARFLARVRETAASAAIIEHILGHSDLATDAVDFRTSIRFRAERNFEFGLGCVEGWRGDVIYWLMQDRFGRIYRCQARDPSVLNWPALKAAVDPHELDVEYLQRHRRIERRAETILADFPIINKSFNLSYSGNDR